MSSEKVIHYYIGTKAQFVKLVPVIRETARRDLPYRIIDAGFHRGLMDRIVDSFGLPHAHCVLGNNTREVRTVREAVRWFLGTGLLPILRRGKLFEDVFDSREGICVVHGDTLAALVGMFQAKACHLPVAHVEAGPRSWHYFDPFPEEIARVLVMRYADILFAPGDWACENIGRSAHSGRVVNTQYNTVLETATLAAESDIGHNLPVASSYCVVTFHRAESLLRKARMVFLCELLTYVAAHRQVVFILHGPTEKSLYRFGIMDRLKNLDNLVMAPLLDYCAFASLIHGADFVMTDGGSIQEECAFLGKPCLLLRANTERKDGLGENVVLSGFDKRVIDDFIQNWQRYERPAADLSRRPSTIIVDELQAAIGWTSDRHHTDMAGTDGLSDPGI